MVFRDVSKRTVLYNPLFLIIFSIVPFLAQAQVPENTTSKTVIAGKQYERNSLHEALWGKNYRKDWATPVNIPTINLDTVDGGLVAYEKGGGRQSKSLRLRNKAGKEYVLRSIDKSFGKALPEIARGTILEDIADDEVSISEPYSALTISPLAEAAGIYHTIPVIVFVPSQKALGEFDKEFANELYLLEQRPDENWEEAVNFGNSKNIVGTDKLLEKLLKNNENSVDQQMFVRARLFDMFIGDWGRHEDQWRWASFEKGEETFYRPVPRDRDQAYSRIEGFLTNTALSAVGDFIEGFSNNIKNVPLYNFPARNLDRRLTNAVTKDQWLSIAAELQTILNDKLIETSINRLPPEVAAISAKRIISTLKQRRSHLAEWAEIYYNALAKEVDIPASQKDEYFTIQKLSPQETLIEIYDLNKEGVSKKNPFYSRKFFSRETDEIRIYGISGNDRFRIEGNSDNGTRIRIIGGPMKDSYMTLGKSNNVHVYDNKDNDFTKLANTKTHLSKDTAIHSYVYDAFKFNDKGISISPSYNEEDRIHVSLKYKYEKQQWRKQPFGFKHEFAVRYSISEKAPSIGYSAEYTKMLCNWDLLFGGNYDWIRWNNYYGIGNETQNLVTDNNYNRVRSKQLDAWLGLGRNFGNHQHLYAGLFYQTVKIIDDQERFLAKQLPKFNEFDTKQFGGGKLEYVYENIDNRILPTKGIRFNANLSYTQNLKISDSSVTHLNSALHLYLPLSKSFVFKTKTGGAVLSGKPEFYQLNKIGGGKSLRGFRRNRFYGESTFFNQAELQFIPNIKTYLFNGRAGLVAFYDIGRVWQPGENSSTWHAGYGGGIVISPFNKVAITVLQGWSKNEKAIAIRFNAGF